MAHTEENVSLAQFTSFKLGGLAKVLVKTNNSEELTEALNEHANEEITILGFGSNVLISDSGLDGVVIVNNGGNIEFEGSSVIVDSGVWWDDLVTACIDKGLWGVELMSEIPGSVGAALFINITAYGQSIGPLVEWIEVWDKTTRQKRNISSDELNWSYKQSIFQENENLVILRAKLNLNQEQKDQLEYQRAVDVADELDFDLSTLQGRRQTIIEARRRAGSLWSPEDEFAARTVGSFFRNPMVTTEQAEKVISFDETGKTKEQIELMNKVHGGDSKRVSAAHVMLAGGFTRGQTWGKVKLNDKNLLKIESVEGATASEVYAVSREIQSTCFEKLGINLEPEVRLLGEF